MDWILFILFALIILFFLAISGFLYKKKYFSATFSRIFVHFTIGIMCGLSPYIFESNLVPSILGLSFVFINIFFHKHKLFESIHSQDRITYGTIYFPLSYLILSSLFWEKVEYFAISYFILAIADPLAAIMGKAFPLRKINLLGDEKSLGGALSMLFASIFIIYLCSTILPFSTNEEGFYIFYFVLFSSIMATMAELISFKGSDNLSIPLVSLLSMYSFYLKPNIFEITLILSLLLLFAFLLNFITLDGFFGSIIMSNFIIAYGGINYLTPLVVFFILSSIISKIKPKNNYSSKESSKRNIIQVFANGGIALSLCVCGGFLDDYQFIYYLFLSSVAAAASDTWGTEFGKFSKYRPISILSLKEMNHGESGGISILGTLGSFMGSCMIGLIGFYFTLEKDLILIVILSGFLSSLLDSIIGASLQGKYLDSNGIIVEDSSSNNNLINGYSWMSNDAVNLINTTFAPIFTLVIFQIKFI